MFMKYVNVSLNTNELQHKYYDTERMDNMVRTSKQTIKSVDSGAEKLKSLLNFDWVYTIKLQ